MQENAQKRLKKPQVHRRVPAVTRAVAILQFLAKTKEPIGVVPLARQVALIPSTCLHIVRVLAEEGFVSFDPHTKQYSIGAGVLALASAFTVRNPFVQVARRLLDDLSRVHDCSFAALELGGEGDCIVVAIGDVRAGLSLRVSVGTRFPAFVSASGLCFAAFNPSASQADLQKGFSELQWDEAPSFEYWLKQVEQTRIFGYAIDDGHFMRGVTSVAIPVFNSAGDLVGSIAAVGLRARFVGDRLTALIDGMRKVGREMNQGLGLDVSFDRRTIAGSEAPLTRALDLSRSAKPSSPL